ncbi:MAG: hypothetical protein LBK67_13100 [Coriobacteriales bacterium]|jgi:hypothetical protein|nr:hypothetical protein [Coriobacteriales bacterium]
MIVDLVGPNCIGKTTLIQHLLRVNNARHLDITATKFASMPSFFDQYRTIFTASIASKFIRKMVWKLVLTGRLGLALRLAHFYSFCCAHPQKTDIVLRDEGLLKKFYEAVPFGPTAEDAAFWQGFTLRFAEDLILSATTSCCAFMFLDIEESRYLTRFRSRALQAKFSDEDILGRFRIQQACSRILFAKAKVMEFPSQWIDIAEIDDAVLSLQGLDFLK